MKESRVYEDMRGITDHYLDIKIHRRKTWVLLSGAMWLVSLALAFACGAAHVKNGMLAALIAAICWFILLIHHSNYLGILHRILLERAREVVQGGTEPPTSRSSDGRSAN